MLSKIYFKNYKAFNGVNEIELKPITLLLGKNSSGKSSITKLLAMLSAAMNGKKGILLPLVVDGVRVAVKYEDLFHNHFTSDMELGVMYDDGTDISCSYLMDNGKLYAQSYGVKKSATNRIVKEFSKEDSAKFKGFLHEEILNENEIDLGTLGFSVNYLGPIREQLLPSFAYSGSNADTQIGSKGEKALDILLGSLIEENDLFENVSDWFDRHLEGQRLEMVSNGPNSGTYSLYVKRNGVLVNAVDVGQGLTQVLPVIVESFLPNSMDIEIMEQPAIHLHPAAHAQVAYRLVESAKTLNKKYVIESHSKNFLLELRKIVALKELDVTPDDIAVYYINSDESGSFIEKITIDENGDLNQWPDGLFEEGYQLLKDILEGRK